MTIVFGRTSITLFGPVVRCRSLLKMEAPMSLAVDAAAVEGSLCMKVHWLMVTFGSAVTIMS